jgi:hypothetical protein
MTPHQTKFMTRKIYKTGDNMKYFRLLTFFILTQIILFSCAKIDEFTSPKLNETFAGSLDIVPNDVTKLAKRETPIVSLRGDGKTAYINNITGLLPLSLEAGAQVSGLVGEIVDKNTIKITGFGSFVEGDYDTHATVSGTLKKKGVELRTTDPIVIKQTLKTGNGDEVAEKIIWTIVYVAESTTVM